MKEFDETLKDDRSSFDKFCDRMYVNYTKEKSTENEKDVLTKEEYRVQYKMFLRHKYREKKADDRRKLLGLD
jgi:hypothetical protein|tara:strand:+ start:204 stop:419 length:216 start_codon:yes stop_codon:yes gene_type:complete